MTQYAPAGPLVVGQPISPFFGAQNGASPPGTLVQIPSGMPMLEAMSRGILPRNADASAINSVSTGAQNPTPMDDLMSNGAGNQVNLGVATPLVAGNPAGNGAANQQQFVDGTAAASQLSNGPTPTSVETLTSCPVSGATYGANVTLSGTYQG